MPTRLIRDGILTSFQVNRLSQGAELFYRRLMSVVDDYGRMEAHPAILLAKCYPLQSGRVTIQDVEKWLSECGELPSDDGGLRSSDGDPLPLVSQYEVKRKKYIQINNFCQRERSEKYPRPENPPSFDGELRQSAAYARASPPPSNTNTTPNGVLVETTVEAVVPLGNGNGMRWASDETFQPFVESYRATGRALVDSDFADAFYVWPKLDFTQKLAAIDGIRNFQGDAQFLKLPRKYLETQEWTRQKKAKEWKGSPLPTAAEVKASLLADDATEDAERIARRKAQGKPA